VDNVTWSLSGLLGLSTSGQNKGAFNAVIPVMGPRGVVVSSEVNPLVSLARRQQGIPLE
jgi:hypothetical protein